MHYLRLSTRRVTPLQSWCLTLVLTNLDFKKDKIGEQALELAL